MAESIELSSALNRVVAGYTRMVRTVAFRRGLSDSDLDEVLQDVRIRLWQAVPRERIDEVKTSYVYRTAMSAVCDLVRRRRSERTDSVEEVTADRGPLAAPGGADQQLERAELAGQIELALGELGPTRRPVVRMYLAGYDQAEIQALFGWTEGKTRNLLYRGLRELRAALTRRGVTPRTAT